MVINNKDLTSVEVYTLLAMIYIARKKQSRGVKVRDLAKVLGRSEGRVRAILSELKKKGLVKDVGRSLRRSEIQDFISKALGRSNESEKFSEALFLNLSQEKDIISTSKGAPEKIWRLNGYDPLNDEGVEKFFKDFSEVITSVLGLSQEEFEKLKKSLLSSTLSGRP